MSSIFNYWQIRAGRYRVDRLYWVEHPIDGLRTSLAFNDQKTTFPEGNVPTTLRVV